MSQRTPAANSDATSQPSSSEAGISLVPPGNSGQLTLDTPLVRQVGPRFTDWLPDVLDALLPMITQTARELAVQYDPRTIRDERPYRFAADLFDTHGVGTAPSADTPTHPFNDALAKFAISYFDVDPDELSDRKRGLYNYARDEILELGTRDLPGAPTGLDALGETIVPLFDAGSRTPTMVFSLDGPAWEEADDDRTAARALDALALLAEVVDIRFICSPRLDAHLERTHPDWYDEHLTDSGDDNREPAPTETNESALSAAWDAIGEFAPGGGRLRLLAALDLNGEREVRDLKADTEIELSKGAIDRYVREFDDEHDLVDIDDRPKYNRVSLTDTGIAAQELIGPEYRVFHPQQTHFDDRLTGTRHGSTGVVCWSDSKDSPPAAGSCGGGDGAGGAGASSPSSLSSSPPSSSLSSSEHSLPASAPTAEDWLAATGEASESGYVQWLDGPDGRLGIWEMHERFLAGRRTEGVTLVDEPVKPFENGKVSYVSCFEDHAQAVVQWGGPLYTLVRITSTLLSEKMFSKVLTPSAVGDDLDELYDGALDDATKDVLRLGAQIGWFGEDEQEYDGLRERFGEIRRLLLSKLAEVEDADATEWSDLCRDAHGLLASATHLYRAVGVDVTIHVRVPDTKKLRAGERRYQDFLDFFKHTVPKNASYGIHSVYRMLYEDRVDKLKHRMSVEFDADAAADLTASWVISGPTASTFREDVQRAIASKVNDVRETIQEGIEHGVSLAIPVVEGNSYGALRRVIDRHAERKGFAALDADERRKLVRLATATLGEEPGRCSPYALAEALLSLGKARSPTQSLRPGDLAAGLTKLPAERLVPSLPPTMQKALKALLVADEPLGASDIIERAGISERSYSRNIGELAALGMVESVGEGGHKKWRAWIIPWWSPLAGVNEPRTDETDESGVTPPSRWDDVLYDIVLALGCDPEYELFAGSVDVDEVFATLPALEWWHGFIESHYGLVDVEQPASTPDGDAIVDGPDALSSVEIGYGRTDRGSEQEFLGETNSSTN
ncbi:plasmid replication protein RepH (plasmid) [Halococcus dombrowskii]|uniref:Plasmid replication protein RepH n=1 Tax=Halococcus dombrowskii TaxID=179637 RepID=A0AAV3SH43_HALDO|nr:plasmid replication protein RepH [Halococcus dombrowskii]UOO97501.1 plasmid replication protein RepH [Halococcus dombrowskii]